MARLPQPQLRYLMSAMYDRPEPLGIIEHPRFFLLVALLLHSTEYFKNLRTAVTSNYILTPYLNLGLRQNSRCCFGSAANGKVLGTYDKYYYVS